ncbi:Y-family DNA polymerase [Prosthecochloris sp. ZM_2]|uniref:Y-family DNA polymerase n=1 Tax=Prosthecochloris sp. ZM_2 TaxID=2045206 RepID=UPI0026D25E98
MVLYITGMFALVDCNNFYVSCERVFNPGLNGRPVVVLSNNDGCIIARSAEAKTLGIAMGTPVFRCRSLLKRHDVAVFSSNYPLYGDMSSRVMALLAELAPAIELYSIDESFLDLSGFGRLDVRMFGQQLRRKVGRWTGIPVSVGIASTKTLAKVANRLAKADERYGGVCVLDDDEAVCQALRQTAVEDIWGIGRRWGRTLGLCGIRTAEDLAAASSEQVRRMLHVTGARVQAELRGQSCLPLEEVRPRKQSICTSRSFGHAVTSFDGLHQAVATFAARTAEKLRQEGLVASMLTVFAGTSRFAPPQERCWLSRTIPLGTSTADSLVLVSAASRLLEALFQQGYDYRKAGVLVSGLEDRAAAAREPELFGSDPGHDDARRKLMAAMDEVNRTCGHGTIRLASEGRDAWRPQQAYLSPRYTTQWSDILEIRG